MDKGSGVTAHEGGYMDGGPSNLLGSVMSARFPVPTQAYTRFFPPGQVHKENGQEVNLWEPQEGEYVLERLDDHDPVVPVRAPRIDDVFEHDRYSAATDCVAEAFKVLNVDATYVSPFPNRINSAVRKAKRAGFKEVPESHIDAALAAAAKGITE